MFLFFCALMITAPAHRSDSKIGIRLQDRLAKLTSGEKELVWIYFKDKGSDLSLNKRSAFQSLSNKALKRRAKVRSSDNLVDGKDFPVFQHYLKAMEEKGIVVRNTSKWLNASSAWVNREEIEFLSALDFVSRIEPVGRFQKNKDIDESKSVELNGILKKSSSSDFDSAFYGYAYAQLKQIKVPEVHQLGFFGQGVTVAVLDNGFRLLSHEALGMNIIGTYDFVDKKVDVAPINLSSDFGSHGINTLSVIGGFKEGKLVGPAYKSDYILARTENDSSETPFEEDNWIAAMEWAEGLGADIISSSLGYINFDSSGALTYDKSVYNWAWMNGDSTVITKGANIGVSMGLVIVNSAGNEGFHNLHNTLGAPADGDSVIAVGAVDALGLRVSFSSVGPTTLGRIKPDVMARGSAVAMASASTVNGYTLNQGTSFSCPLTAGVCALMLSARPDLTPAQVRWVLRHTADRSLNPDNQYGYGIINALSAVNFILPLPPVPPQEVSAEPDNGQVTLKWEQSATPKFLRYRIYNGTSPNPVTVIDSISVREDTTKTFMGLTDGITYYFRLTVVDSNYSESSFSNEASAIPGAPSAPANVLGIPDTGKIVLKWKQSVASDFLRYRIYGGTSPNPLSIIDSIGLREDTVKTIAGLTGDIAYYYRLTVLDSTYLESSFSNEVKVVPYSVPNYLVTDNFFLHQNYPNPFNPGTMIKYDVFKAGNVNMSIYNILGQKIKTLVNGFKPVGPYFAEWDGKDSEGNPVSSGVYFYRLEGKNFSKTKKMLLIR